MIANVVRRGRRIKRIIGDVDIIKEARERKKYGADIGDVED
jgi:hypothetical protein